MAVLEEPAEGVKPPRLAGWRQWLPLLLGLAAAYALLNYTTDRFLFDPETAGLGQNTQPLFGVVDGRQVHCNDMRDSAVCVNAYRSAGRPPAALWLGNSQLHGVNRYVEGQVSAPMILHRALAQRGLYLVTYSQPNANVMEHKALFETLRRDYDLRELVVAVCFDDFREDGVRDTVLPAAEKPERAQAKDRPNTQKSVEAFLDGGLRQHFRLWRMREGLMGTADYAAYVLRNKLLGINAQTPRSVSSAIYGDRLRVVRELVAEASQAGIRVVLYVPPFRSDVKGPYVPEEYARFRADLAHMANGSGVKVLDLTDVVPGSEWGKLKDPLFGFEDYDFMHFTAEGHRRLAEALAPAV